MAALPRRGSHFVKVSQSVSRAQSSAAFPKQCMVFMLEGLTPYEDAWKYQKVLSEHIHSSKKSGSPSPCALVIVEHPRVFTLGRGGSVDNLLFNPGDVNKPDVIRVERGGEITWHGPGQIVAYPILDLDNHKRDLHWYTERLEESVIQLLKTEYGVESGRNDVNTGVWVGTNKIAAVGVTASRWITMHGIALNVNVDMQDFGLIVPCGITETNHGVTSLRQARGQGSLDLTKVRSRWVANLQKTFQFDELLHYQGKEALAHLESLLEQHPHVAEQSLKPNEL